MPTIAILGTMDTKGAEHAFVAEQIRAHGHQTLIIDVGTLGEPGLRPDISRTEVAKAAGVDLAVLVANRDRGEAVTAMAKGAAVVAQSLAATGRIQGIISLGGGGGTAIGTAAMRALPIGFPKVMVSTQSGGSYSGATDICMIYSVTDIAGLNSISRVVLANAASQSLAQSVLEPHELPVVQVRAVLTNLSHSFPDDLDILLVAPNGRSTLLMSDAGGESDITNVVLKFDDQALQFLPDNTQIFSGTNRPTDYEPGDIFPAPAPAVVLVRKYFRSSRFPRFWCFIFIVASLDALMPAYDSLGCRPFRSSEGNIMELMSEVSRVA